MAEPVKGSNYLWWFFFTGSVLSGFVITLMLDGFFGTTKSEETLTYGVRGCAPSIVSDLGFAVEGTVDAIGLPRIDYIESTAAFGDVMNGETHNDRRNRRSVGLTQDGNDDATHVGNRVMGANFTGSGPVPGEKGCIKMLKDYADFVNGGEDGDDVPTDEEKMEWWENADNKPFHLMMCIASSKLAVLGGGNCHLGVSVVPVTNPIL